MNLFLPAKYLFDNAYIIYRSTHSHYFDFRNRYYNALVSLRNGRGNVFLIAKFPIKTYYFVLW